MNFRVTISIAVLLLIAANAVLVVSYGGTCPPDVKAQRGKPGYILCPCPEKYDCDNGKAEWGSVDSEWIIFSRRTHDPHWDGGTYGGDYYRLSYEGESYPFIGSGREVSFRAPFIDRTDAQCGGRLYVPSSGNFRPDRSGNESDHIYQSSYAYAHCYQVYDCNWKQRPYNILGWRWVVVNAGQSDEYWKAVQSAIPSRYCEASNFVGSANNFTWIPCTDDGY